MNKEIEELLNELKEYASGGMSGLYPSEDTVKEFVSYIEQLEKRNESLLKDRRELLHLVRQLENNRDKAIEYLKEKADYPISYYHCIRETIDILKGGSDE